MSERIRIRHRGREQELPDLGSAIRLAQAGELGLNHELWLDGVWRPAGEVRELKPYLAGDPWAVWDEADAAPDPALETGEPVEVPIDALRPMLVVGEARVEELAEPQIEPLDGPELAPIARKPGNAGGAIGSPAGLASPPPVGAQQASQLGAQSGAQPGAQPRRAAQVLEVAGRERPPRPSSDGNTGEVIPFPTRPRVETLTSPPRPSTVAVRPTHLASWVFVGLLFVAAGFIYFEAVAGWDGVLRRPASTAVPVVPPADPAVSAATPVEAPEPADPARSSLPIDESLRDRLPAEVRPVNSAADVEDGLFLILGQVGLDVESVEVTVNAWGGKNNDVPRDIGLRITWRGGEDATQELAAAALGVGRMLSTQSIAASRLEVRVRLPTGELASRSFDGVKVRAYYDQKIGLDALLAE